MAYRAVAVRPCLRGSAVCRACSSSASSSWQFALSTLARHTRRARATKQRSDQQSVAAGPRRLLIMLCHIAECRRAARAARLRRADQGGRAHPVSTYRFDPIFPSGLARDNRLVGDDVIVAVLDAGHRYRRHSRTNRDRLSSYPHATRLDRRRAGAKDRPWGRQGEDRGRIAVSAWNVERYELCHHLRGGRTRTQRVPSSGQGTCRVPSDTGGVAIAPGAGRAGQCVCVRARRARGRVGRQLTSANSSAGRFAGLAPTTGPGCVRCSELERIGSRAFAVRADLRLMRPMWIARWRAGSRGGRCATAVLDRTTRCSLPTAATR